MTDIPRRCDLDRMTPAERAIYDALAAVEALPADPRLTEAGTLLQQAQAKVADFVDGVLPPEPIGSVVGDLCAGLIVSDADRGWRERPMTRDEFRQFIIAADGPDWDDMRLVDLGRPTIVIDWHDGSKSLYALDTDETAEQVVEHLRRQRHA